MNLPTRRLALLGALLLGIGASMLIGGQATRADTSTVTFESFTVGNINGQNGWTKTNAAFDVAVVSNGGGVPASFGTKSLRISNAVTSGSFGDQTFSNSLANEAGEVGATNGGFSGGVRQAHFDAQFDVFSTQADPAVRITGTFAATEASCVRPRRIVATSSRPLGMQ